MAGRYSFGDFVVDTGRHSLCRGSEEVVLGERSFKVLCVLIENRGNVVGRRQLIDEAWNDVAVSDDSLARAISDLRSALGDSASDPRFIRTVHRRGYLFVAPVAVAEGAETSSTGVPAASKWSANVP